MKKKLLLIVLSVVCLALVVGAVFVANANEEPPATKIAGHTLTLADSIAIKYAVQEKNLPTGAQTGVICWTAPQESYTLENTSGQFTMVRSGKSGQYIVYTFNQLVAKMMADDIYAVSYIKVGDEVTYSAVDKYSVLQYCYSKKGSTETVSGGSATLGELIVDILNYGASAQKFFGYKTDRLANAAYYQIKTVGGTLPDGTKSGLYQAGEEITLTATLPEGATFFRWQNGEGEQVGTTAEMKVTVPASQETYTAVSHILQWFQEVPATETETGVIAHYHCADCGKDFDENYIELTDLIIPVIEAGPIYSEGLQFVSNDDGTCTVSGIGTCTDTDVLIPPVSPDGDTVTNIGKNAFYGCTGLTSVTIPDSVTSIGSSAFSNCTNLESIVVESGNTVYHSDNNCIIETASKTLIAGCKTSVIPADGSVTSIGDSAFRSCTGLTSVTIPDSVTSIGAYAFYGCTGLESVTIPDSVTRIGNFAFYGCTKFTSITIPNSVTSIGNSAFYNCRIETAIIPTNVISSISKGYLKTVVFTGGTSIGDRAFSGCTGLTSITIPDSVTSIGNNAFQNCTGLTNVYITDLAKWCGISFGSSDANPLYYAHNLYLNGELVTDLVIPDSVTSIGNYAFSGCTGLTSITIPNSVTSIGNYAFSGCTGLTSVTIPDSVTSIGERAFAACKRLKSVTIGNGVTSIGTHAFYNTALETMTIPFVGATKDGTSNTNFGYIFGASSYSKNANFVPTSLKTVIITGGTGIGNYAFYQCSGLTSITIPDSVTSIGNSAFNGCSGLKGVYIADLAAWCSISFGNSDANPLCYAHNLYLNGELIAGNFVIPDSVTGIGNYAFYYSSGLTSVTIPNSVTSIGSYAFSNCFNLTSMTIPNSVTGIGESSFADCTKLTSATIPNSVTSIGKSAFNNCSNLRSITIPFVGAAKDETSNTHFGYIFGASYYGQNANYIPYLLKTVVITGGSSIGYGAFYGCSNLTSITIPNSVNSIESSAFENCTGLTSVTIPDSVTSIGNCAFSGCPIETATIPTNAISYIPKNDLKKVVITSGTSIGEDAFYDCSKLTSVTIPNSVTSIEYGAFMYCTRLWSVTIPSSVTSIGDCAFMYCTGLGSVTIPDSVTSIGYQAFDSCTFLSIIIYDGDEAEWNAISKGSNWDFNTGNYDFYFTNHSEGLLYESTGNGTCYVSGIGVCTDSQIDIPRFLPNGERVIGIKQFAFRNCTELTSIIIPASVTSIGFWAFSGCSNLTNIYIKSIETWCSISFTDSYTNPLYYAHNLYLNGELVTDLVIPESVTSIGQYAFYGYSRLTSVTIPDSVTSIGKGAFNDCTGLTSVYITDLAKWCAISFGNSYANPLYYAHNLYLKGELVTNLVIPGSVTSIGQYAFHYCTELTSVTIPDSVTSIGNDAFYNCTNLYRVINHSNLVLTLDSSDNGYVANYAKLLIDKDGNTSYKDDGYTYLVTEDEFLFREKDGAYTLIAYLGGKGTVTLPAEINGNAYSIVLLCGVRNVIIPGSVTSIGNGAFSGCTGIKSITIPNNVTSIGYQAFFGCKGLTSVTIPDSVTSIGDQAFQNCTRLTSVTIPGSVTSIGSWAFNGCSGLMHIEFEGTKAQWNAITKGSSWNSSTGNYIIHCTDGDLTK